MTAVAASIIVGPGLLFSGLRMVDANLRQVTGRRPRTAVARMTTRLALLVGAPPRGGGMTRA